MFWNRSQRRRAEVLAVTTDPSVASIVEDAAADVARVIVLDDPHAAMAVLGSRPLSGAVFDGALPGRMALALSRAFLQHQPTGHVAILSTPDDPTTLVGLAFRDSRVELLFRPVAVGAVRELLFAEASCAAR